MTTVKHSLTGSAVEIQKIWTGQSCWRTITDQLLRDKSDLLVLGAMSTTKTLASAHRINVILLSVGAARCDTLVIPP